MSMATRPLEDLIQDLPANLRGEVRDFVEFLLTRRNRPDRRPLRQDWAEALKEDPDEYTSVDLQHLALDWRTK